MAKELGFPNLLEFVNPQGFFHGIYLRFDDRFLIDDQTASHSSLLQLLNLSTEEFIYYFRQGITDARYIRIKTLDYILEYGLRGLQPYKARVADSNNPNYSPLEGTVELGGGPQHIWTVDNLASLQLSCDILRRWNPHYGVHASVYQLG